MTLRRGLTAVVCAGGAALILSTHVFVAVDRGRFKLVTSPVAADKGRVRATTDEPDLRQLHPPFALIARVHHDSSDVGTFAIEVDGAPACERQARGDDSRLDCFVTTWGPGAEHVVTVTGPATPWKLDYLELATHHGSSSGVIETIVLPGGADRFTHLGPVSIAALSLLVLVLVALPAPQLPGWFDLACKASGYVVIALFAAIQCSNWVTNFDVILSLGSFVRLLALASASRLWVAIHWLAAAPRSQAPDTDAARGGMRHATVIVRALLVALAVMAAYYAVVRVRLRDTYSGNYSGFLHVSREAFDTNPLLRSRVDIRQSLVLEPGGGYDGQFMYFAVFDPALRSFSATPALYRRVMDAPPYRYDRIGYSLLTRAVSAGRWERYPATMVWMILVSLAATAFVLAIEAQARGLTPAVGALVLAIPGFWTSVQTGLPEPIAAAALVGGLLCLWRRNAWLAGGLLALSLLIRETGVIAVLCAAIAAAVAGRRRDACIVILLAGGVTLAWRLYVAWVLFPDWGAEGLLFRPPDLGWPMAGIIDLWGSIAHGRYYPGMPDLSRAGMVYPLLLIAGFVLSLALALAVSDAMAISALVYAVVALSLNFPAIWIHVANGQRGTYDLFLMLCLVTLAMGSFPARLRHGLVAFWLCSAAYVVFFAYDSQNIRSALLSF